LGLWLWLWLVWFGLWFCVGVAAGGLAAVFGLGLVWVGFVLGAWLLRCVVLAMGVGLGAVDEPESLILAQSERWRHA